MKQQVEAGTSYKSKFKSKIRGNRGRELCDIKKDKDKMACIYLISLNNRELQP